MGILVEAEQRSDEWFAARLGRATASRFGDIIARTKTGYASSRANYKAELVIERLTGQRVDMFTNKAMEWGTETEDLARLAYTLETGNEVEETGFYIHETLMCGASPDGLVGDEGTLEIKCPNTATHIETLRRATTPNKYKAQIQGQLWLTGRKFGDFESFDPRLPSNAEKFIERNLRDDEYIAMLEKEVTQFLKEVDEEVQFIKNYKAPVEVEV